MLTIQLAFDPATQEVPEKPQDTLNLYRRAREERLDLEKLAAEFKQLETALKDKLINTFPVGEGVVADGYACEVTAKSRYIVEEKGKLRDYIVNTGAIDLLQFRISESAVSELVDSGETVPGIGTMIVKDLSVRVKK